MGYTLILQADMAALMSLKVHFNQFSLLAKIKFHIQPSWACELQPTFLGIDKDVSLFFSFPSFIHSTPKTALMD